MFAKNSSQEAINGVENKEKELQDIKNAQNLELRKTIELGKMQVVNDGKILFLAQQRNELIFNDSKIQGIKYGGN